MLFEHFRSSCCPGNSVASLIVFLQHRRVLLSDSHDVRERFCSLRKVWQAETRLSWSGSSSPYRNAGNRSRLKGKTEVRSLASGIPLCGNALRFSRYRLPQTAGASPPSTSTFWINYCQTELRLSGMGQVEISSQAHGMLMDMIHQEHLWRKMDSSACWILGIKRTHLHSMLYFKRKSFMPLIDIKRGSCESS